MEETEKEYSERILKQLRPYFEIFDEVWDRTGKNRIDYVLKLRNHSPAVYFGLECKRFDRKRGEKIGKYIKQAMRYIDCEFNVEKNGVFIELPIFIAPALSINYFVMNEELIIVKGRPAYHDRHTLGSSHHTFNGVLGEFGLGEIRRRVNEGSEHFYFSFSNFTIWSSEKKWNSNEVRGLHDVNYQKLLHKLHRCDK